MQKSIAALPLIIDTSRRDGPSDKPTNFIGSIVMSQSQQKTESILNNVDVSDIGESAYLVLFNPNLSEQCVSDIKSKIGQMYEIDKAGMYSVSAILDAHHDEDHDFSLSEEDINTFSLILSRGINTIELEDTIDDLVWERII